jgi:hypothetical protein
MMMGMMPVWDTPLPLMTTTGEQMMMVMMVMMIVGPTMAAVCVGWLAVASM